MTKLAAAEYRTAPNAPLAIREMVPVATYPVRSPYSPAAPHSSQAGNPPLHASKTNYCFAQRLAPRHLMLLTGVVR